VKKATAELKAMVLAHGTTMVAHYLQRHGSVTAGAARRERHGASRFFGWPTHTAHQYSTQPAATNTDARDARCTWCSTRALENDAARMPTW
jgi:hypothetical protein